MKKYFTYIIVSHFLLIHIHVFAQVPVLNSYSPAAAAVYLDFDGAEVEGTIWNDHIQVMERYCFAKPFWINGKKPDCPNIFCQPM